jgi:hypothetical protein
VADFDGAVRIYRYCRRTGITPPHRLHDRSRRLRFGAIILTYDTEMASIADVMHFAIPNVAAVRNDKALGGREFRFPRQQDHR